MRRRIAILVASVALVGAACGDDSEEPATVQSKLAAEVISEYKKVSGLKVDEGCIKDAASKLSDADAQTLLDNLDAEPSTVAPTIQAFLDESGDCVTAG